jgi:hypothetical protein
MATDGTLSARDARMLERWRRIQAKRRLVRQMTRARERGCGVYVVEWTGPAATGHDFEQLAEKALDWCRQTVARCRRPWGVDYFDLAVSCARDRDDEPRTQRLAELRPSDLYGEGDLASRLVGFLSSFSGDDQDQSDVVRVCVGLFSWGDALHAALPAAS